MSGREFTAQDTSGAPPVVIVNEAMARRYWPGQEAVGKQIKRDHAVTERTREIGIRLALGAQPRNLLTLVVGQGMMLTLIGVVIGVGASFALTQLIEKLLFGVSATDPLTFAIIPLLLASVALLACWIPARRATRMNPLVALRYD